MQTTGLIDKKYISVLDPLLDAREINQKIVDIQNDDMFMSFLAGAGLKAPVSMTGEESIAGVYTTWLNDPLSVLIDTTGATVTTTGNPTITVTVLPSASQGILVPGVQLYFPNGKVGVVTSVPTAASFVVQSIDGSNLTLTAGMFLSAFSSASEDGSTGPTAQRWGVTKLQNNLQIIRTAISLTDVQQQMGVEFKVNGEMRVAPYMAIRGHDLHKQKISGAFLMGSRSSTLFSDASPTLTGPNGRAIQTTRGMWDYITTYGVNDALTTPGTVTLDDWTDFEQLLKANRSPLRYLVGGNHTVTAKISNWAKGLPSSGAMNSLRVPINGRDVDLSVEKFTHAGFEMNIAPIGLMDNAQIANYAVTSGGARTTLGKSALFMPIGQVNSVGNSSQPYFRYRYAPVVVSPSANRTIKNETVETVTGGQAPIATDTTATMRIDWSSTVGLEVLAPQHFGALQIL